VGEANEPAPRCDPTDLFKIDYSYSQTSRAEKHYRIPALEIYYSRCLGVELVEEGDAEALTVKAIEILEKGVEAVEPLKIKSCRDNE
jgi:hypothetical protein